ncbi:Ger(x)C family spore germination protein [Ammoniphilus sp. YIM 78166]|uniref:Ger(x)C family spore germination protein n=1 Tax=Ammoniphilus sp. YIM 78166 TaxID=1644106 RepID=UPI00106F92D0|nr:Ger(x)C family spore germination protein [Ammoniphilus sp. YIM 78166]
MKSRVRTCLISLCLLIILPGCWDRVEINDVALVAGTAIDKQGGEYEVTIQIPLPGQMGGSSGGGGGGTAGSGMWYAESSRAPTIREANEQHQKRVSRELNFSHRRIFIIGEEVAKEGVAPIMDVTVRVPQNRLSSLIAVTKGKAQEVLGADAPIENLPSEMIRELTQNSMVHPPIIKNFVRILLREGIDPIIPYLSVVQTAPGAEGKTQTTIQLEGMAVFNGDQMTGVLKGEQANALMMVMDEAPNPSVKVKPPRGEGEIVIQLQEIKVKLLPQKKGPHYHMNIRLQARGRITENESNFVISNHREMEQLFNQTIQKNIEKSIDVLQHEYHSDPIGMGQLIRHRYKEDWESLKTDWKEHYARVKTNVDVQITIENTGSITSKPFGYKEGELIR